MPKGTSTGSNTNNNTNTNSNSNISYLTPNIDTTTYIRSQDRVPFTDGRVISAVPIVRETTPSIDHWKSTNK